MVVFALNVRRNNVGEIADMMLDGTLCECCGEFLEDSDGDFPQRCAGCCGEEDGDGGHFHDLDGDYK